MINSSQLAVVLKSTNQTIRASTRIKLHEFINRVSAPICHAHVHRHAFAHTGITGVGEVRILNFCASETAGGGSYIESRSTKSMFNYSGKEKEIPAHKAHITCSEDSRRKMYDKGLKKN